MTNSSTKFFRKNIHILLVCLLALTLRLYHLTEYDFSFDESASDTYSSIYLSMQSNFLGRSRSSILFDQVKNDPHSPLYYLIVYLYSHFWGDGVSLRWISFVFSLLSLLVFYKLSRLFFSRQISFYALLIMAVNPFHLWYAQEARAYATACFFALSAVYVFVKAFRTNKNIYWLVFSIVGIFSIFLCQHSLFLFLFLPLFLRNNRTLENKCAVSFLIILIVTGLVQFLLIDQLEFVKEDFWLLPPDINSLLMTLKVFILGYTGNDFLFNAGIVLFAGTYLYGIYCCFNIRKDDGLILAALLLGPVALSFLFSEIFFPVYLNRQLLILSPFLYLIAAYGIGNINNKKERGLILSLIIVLSSASILNYYKGNLYLDGKAAYAMGGIAPKKKYNHLFDFLKRNFEQGDGVIATNPQTFLMTKIDMSKNYNQYPNNSKNMLRFVFCPLGTEPYTLRLLDIKKRLQNLSEEEVKKLYFFEPLKELKLTQVDMDPFDFDRLWVFSSSWDKSGHRKQDVDKIMAAVPGEFQKVATKESDGVFLDLFARGAPLQNMRQ